MIDLYLNSSTLTKIIIASFWILISIQTYRMFLWKNKIFQLIGIIGIYVIYYFVIEFFTAINFNIYTIIYVLPTLFLSLSSYLIHKYLESIKEVKDLELEIPFSNGKNVTVDAQLGLTVQGAAGSGKTASIASHLLKHFGKNNVGGVLYDYKDFELVEMANYFYKDSEVPLLPFAPYDPNKSIQYNPLDIDILKTHEDVKIMSKCVLDNVTTPEDKKGGKFFIDAAEGAITGVIYSLKENYPQYCSFSYLTAIFLTKEVDDLVDFIEKSENGKIHARAFLDSAESEKQMAGIKATLSNAFSNFANPNIFYTLQKNSEDFSINEKHNKAVFCAINKPSYDSIYSPILSVVIQSLIMKMSERGREKSFILLDEAPTIRINRIGRVPATMRSFGVATIYMLQDTIQAVVEMGRDRMKELFANLSTKCFGKTNDPETAKFFESYFDEKTIKQKSISFKSSGWSEADKRTSVSEKKEKEHKAHEMFKRNIGEFFIFDQKGKAHNGRIQLPKYELLPSEVINTISQAKLDYNYRNILETAKKL